jgi:thiol-disulfide isomerase/thioredoxin
MSTLKFFLASAILALSFPLAAQQASKDYQSLSLEQLKQRLDQGEDTTFVINFWATWCAPCLAEMPYFEQLQENYAEQKVKVLLVSVDDPSRAERALGGFLERRQIKAEIIHLNEDKPHIYIDQIETAWSGSIPATLVLRPEKNQRAFYEGELKYESLLELVKPLM